MDVYHNHQTIAESLLYADAPEEFILVQRVNKEKTVLHFIVSKEKFGLVFYGNHPVKPKVAEVCAVRFTQNDKQQKSNFYQLLSIRLVNNEPSKDIYKEIVGTLDQRPGNSFGFINNVYVSAFIINKYKLSDGDLLKAKAILSYNSKRKEWGWSVILIEK